MEQHVSNKRGIIGLVLVLVGVILIATNLRIFPYEWREYIFSWQSLLIIIGIVLVSSRHSQITGIILILVGGFFLLPDLLDRHFDVWRLFWPTIFIVLGLYILYRSFYHRPHHPEGDSVGDSTNYLDDMALFGGGKKVIFSENFHGGKVTAIFGGSDFMLKDAKLAKGKNVIDVFTIFGGAKFIVPDDWNIKIDVTGIFGGFSDKRHSKPDRIPDPDSILVIKGISIFGGGEIKSY